VPEAGMRMNLNFTGDGIIKKNGLFIGVNGLFSKIGDEDAPMSETVDGSSTLGKKLEISSLL
jgi:hypothetical protein